MLKLNRSRLGAFAALLFGVALSFGAFADDPFPIFPPLLEGNGPCVACHMGCDTARQECVASGQGNCFSAFRLCTQSCSSGIPGCQIP